MLDLTRDFALLKKCRSRDARTELWTLLVLSCQLSEIRSRAQWAWRRNGDDGGDDGDGGAGQSVLYREAAIESRIFAAIAPASVDRVAGEWVRGHEWRGLR